MSAAAMCCDPALGTGWQMPWQTLIAAGSGDKQLERSQVCAFPPLPAKVQVRVRLPVGAVPTRTRGRDPPRRRCRCLRSGHLRTSRPTARPLRLRRACPPPPVPDPPLNTSLHTWAAGSRDAPVLRLDTDVLDFRRRGAQVDRVVAELAPLLERVDPA